MNTVYDITTWDMVGCALYIDPDDTLLVYNDSAWKVTMIEPHLFAEGASDLVKTVRRVGNQFYHGSLKAYCSYDAIEQLLDIAQHAGEVIKAYTQDGELFFRARRIDNARVGRLGTLVIGNPIAELNQQQISAERLDTLLSHVAMRTATANERYHSRYNNLTYRMATQEAQCENPPRHAIDRANLLLDAAMSLCGHPSYQWPEVDWSDSEVCFLLLFADDLDLLCYPSGMAQVSIV